jgi:PAS domain S-box-containing protein
MSAPELVPLAGSRHDPSYDSIVVEAARSIGAPVALLGFVDGGGESIRASHGWELRQLPLHASFAARIRDARDVVVASDARADIRFATHPLVANAPHIGFYAGVPLLLPDGSFAGAISLLDRAPRTLTADQIAILRLLGKQVMRELAIEAERRAMDEELARANEMLAESEGRFHEFFEQTDDLVMSIAPDGRLLHGNAAVTTALGLDRAELTRVPLIRVVDPESRDAFRAAFAAAFDTGEPQRLETTFVTSDGRRIIVEGSLRPRLVDGKPLLARVIFRDITDRTQFESELGSARDAALEAARLKTQFLTNVSHEIRTPMNGVIGTIDLLLSSALSGDQKDLAHQARASAEELLSIVNNILYVSNIEAGGLAAANVDFDLYRMLQRIVEVIKIGALGKDLDISFTYDPQLPPIFRGNQSKIRQVIGNLLDNAVKFTEQGSVSLRVFQQTETETHNVVRFEVRDTGIGVDDEYRLLLFEKFSQIEATSTRRFQGIGLGLATARQLVETMGGLIDVESKPGVGSTFWFSIPFPKVATGRNPIASSELDFKGKRVLLIDQLPTSRRIVRHYLETTWMMNVETAQTSAEALPLLRRQAVAGDPIRVVIFDALPDADVKAFARSVRGDLSLAGTSLVHLLAVNAPPDESLLREAGISAYVTKPVGQRELFDALTVALAHDAIPLARSAMLQQNPIRTKAPDVPMEKRRTIRVLLAEDNFLNRKLTLSQLQKLGYVADAVANGKEAVEAMASRPYDVILMDCQMPIVDGYEATIEIRKRQRDAKRTYIIAMTANALEGDREKCLAAGMDDYLAKPTKQEDLEAALARSFASVQ